MSKILSSLAVSIALAHAASSACTNPTQRVAWSTLTNVEKSDYIQAELCLTDPARAPSKTGYADAKTRWDEFQAMHVAQVQFIHTTGSFFPWHRYYMTVHETLLREECNFTGDLPYWDEQADQGSLPIGLSSIFDPATGFGSNTTDSNGCVDGPFANLTVNLFQNLSRGADKCLTRSLDQSAFDLVAQSAVDLCMEATNYVDWTACAGGDIHIAGHDAVGGLMLDISLSPGDPLFFMHHTNLDRIWWEWQSKDLSTRLTEVGGINVGVYSILTDAQPPSLPVSAFLPYFGDNGNVTTLDHVLWMAETLPNRTIADVMNIQGDYLCFEYV